jgi:hypothetical protein
MVAISASTALAAAAVAASAASAGAGIMSANASSKAAKDQNRLARENFERQQGMSDAQLAMAKAPTTDARGNRSEYIEGQGWVETPSAITRTLMARSDQEEALRNAQDQPRARRTREALAASQARERGLANTLLARSNIGTRSLDDVRASDIRVGIADAAAAPRAVSNAATLTALRQGTGAQETLAQLGRQNIQDRRNVLARADANAPAQFAQSEEQRLTGPLNRYNMLMGRGTANAELPFVPNTLAETLTAARSKQQAIAPQAIGSAMNTQAPKIAIEDDMLAQRLGSAAGTLKYLGGQDFDTLFGRTRNEPFKKPTASDGSGTKGW